MSVFLMPRGETYGKQDITEIHQHHNDSSHASVVGPVAGNDESNSDDVMRIHLPMILPPLLDVDHKELVEPETKLREVVEFG